MAFEIPGAQFSFVAGEDLRTKRFYFLKLHTDGTVLLCAADTDNPIGILQNTPNTGQMATVMVDGVSKVVGSADLALGDLVGTTSAGKAATYAHGTDTTKYIVGRVIEENSADGGVASIIFSCFAVARAT
jgi:hypothetical protein